MFSQQHLYCLRNHVEIIPLITHILELPSKEREGYFRFLCPLCQGFDTATNPETNLARCFTCRRNFNPIDLTMTVKHYSFTQAATYLGRLLERLPPSSYPPPTHPPPDQKKSHTT